MSPLTKLFVGLLVILSVVMTATFVTFVNTIDDYRKNATDAENRVRAEAAKVVAAEQAAASARATAQESYQQAQAQLEDMKKSTNALQQLVADRDARVAEATSRLAVLSADVTRLTEALASSEQTKSLLQGQLNDARAVADARLKENGELNLAVTDLTNRLEVTERERQFLAEQLVETKGQADRFGALLRDAGISSSMVASRIVAPPIRGVIREVRPIQGIPYARISVGANDSVAPGMEFKVINRDTGDFLGVLTVDSVELTEAAGKLKGPRIAEIAPGSEVRTQL